MIKCVMTITEYKPPTLEDVPEHKPNPHELIEAGIQCIPYVGKFISEIYSNAMQTGKHSPDEQLIKSQFQWLIDQIPSIQKKLDLLLERLSPEEYPESSDIGAIFEAAIKASKKTADFKKRKLLKNALTNSFSEEQYKKGISLLLFEIIEDLTYSHITILNKLAEYGTTEDFNNSVTQDPKMVELHESLKLNQGNPNQSSDITSQISARGEEIKRPKIEKKLTDLKEFKKELLLSQYLVETLQAKKLVNSGNSHSLEYSAITELGMEIVKFVKDDDILI